MPDDRNNAEFIHLEEEMEGIARRWRINRNGDLHSVDIAREQSPSVEESILEQISTPVVRVTDQHRGRRERRERQRDLEHYYCYDCGDAHGYNRHIVDTCTTCNFRHRPGMCQGPYCDGCDTYHTGDRCVYCEMCAGHHQPPVCRGTPVPGCACPTCEQWRAPEENETTSVSVQEIRVRQPFRDRNRYARQAGVRQDRSIHGYSYVPMLHFMGEGPLFFGMELELESRNDRWTDAQQVQDVVGNLGWCKEDGSLNCGFELVTMPMSYQFFMEEFPWPRLTECLADLQMNTTNGTGLHVHASRAGFSGPAHVYKWLQLWYRNQDKITRMARRRDSQWGSFRPDDRTFSKFYAKGYPTRRMRGRDLEQVQQLMARTYNYPLQDIQSGYYNNGPNPNRYSAINFTSEHGTYEVRVFRSTTNEQTARAAVGLVAATADYAQKLTAHGALRGGLEWSAFASFVKDSPQYTPLWKEMRVRRCAS